MDLFLIYKNLVKETLLFKSFKGMAPALRAFCFIGLLPFIAVYISMLLGYLAVAIAYRIFDGCFSYLNNFLKVESRDKDIKHATQAVMYFIGFPTVFVLKVGLYAFTVILHFIHFSTSIVGYIATFGGIKFSPFMLDNVDRFSDRGPVKHNSGAVAFFSVFAILFLTLSIGFQPVADAAYESYKDNEVNYLLYSETTRAYNNEKISYDDYDSFVNDYNAGKINGDNYLEYENKYLGGIDHMSWDVQKEADFHATVDILAIIFIASYILFVILFTCIYNNVGQRKKYIEYLSKDPQGYAV